MMIELISGVTFQSGLLEDVEVEAAVSRGEIPQVPIVTAKHNGHAGEAKVQAYLHRHGIPTSRTYQSMFVGSRTGSAVSEQTVANYGIPLVIRPELVAELVVACLGDLQNVVSSILEGEPLRSALDERIVNLATVEDRESALRELCERAEIHNCMPRANPIYVEARIYRGWMHRDFVRPCLARDYRKASGVKGNARKPMWRRSV